MMVSVFLSVVILTLGPLSPPRESEVVAIVEEILAQDQYNPWLLLALGLKESNLSTKPVGKLGECGAFQVLGKYVGMNCAELQTPNGSVQGAIKALNSFKEYCIRNSCHYLDCYASGTSCNGKRATRRVRRGSARLAGTANALTVVDQIQHISTDILFRIETNGLSTF